MPRGVGAAQKKGVHAPKAHKLAEEFAPRTVLQDVFKKRWQLSSVIGQGGFGMIYLASDKIGSVDEKAANHVIKIEPKENGPLYCEMQFYQRVAKPHSIQSFITSHKLRYLSVPPYISTGRHMQSGKEFRFLVMPRFGTDLQKYLVQNGGHFNAKTVFAVGLRMLDALEFLHNNEFVHADVKAANILTGYHAGSEVMNEVYLVDYGLAYRYTVDGVHKEYKEDPRKAHDGTIEFTSRDAHKGVAPSRRADLEILGYCLLQWLCGRLPWEDRLSDLRYVADSKERLTADPGLLIRACHSGPRPPSLECICKYMDKVNALDYDSRPDYTGFRDLMRSAGLKAGLKDEWKLDLGASVGTMQAKVGGAPSGEWGEMGEQWEEPPSMPDSEQEEAVCEAEGSTPGGLVVVGQEVGRLEEILAQLLHQFSSDVLSEPQLQPTEILGSISMILAVLYLVYLIVASFFTPRPSSLEENLKMLKEATMQ